jgi:small-conductance mechanosensitive channel
MKSIAARGQMVRSWIAAAVAIAGLVVASLFGHPREEDLIEKLSDPSASDYIALVGGAAFILASVIAIRAATKAVGRAVEERLGEARGSPLAFLISLVGYSVVILAILQLIGIRLQGLLVGTAITGIILGIAAQQTLANFFAGIVLMFVRPFSVGDHLVMRSGPLGGEYEGRVTDVSFFYVDLVTDQGPVKLPNAGVLAAAIGPGARAPKDELDEAEETQASPAEGGAPKA